MIRTIHLHGDLREKFGSPFRLDVDSAGEATRALAFQVPGFRDVVARGRFHVIRGKPKTGISIGEGELTMKLGKVPDLHIVPVMAGAGGNGRGIAKIVLGVALIAGASIGAAGFLAAGAAPGFGDAALSLGSLGSITWGNIAGFGLTLALTGVSSLLASQAQVAPDGYTNRERPDNQPSFIFNGPVNTIEQGGVVPLIYGKCIVGSTVISAGMSTDDIPQNYAPPMGGGTNFAWYSNTRA